MKVSTAEDRRNLAGDLRDLWFPSLILCGEDEPFLDAAKIFAKFMCGTFAVMRGKNHSAAFAAKDEVCDALLDFLDELDHGRFSRLVRGERNAEVIIGECVDASVPDFASAPGEASQRHSKQVRGLSSDAVMVRQNWLKAYDYVTAEAAVTLNDYARGNDPFARLGRGTIAIEVTSAVRASPASFQLRWQEQSFEGGALVATKRFTGLFTMMISAPRDEARLRRNPLGIYITAFNWGQDLGGEK